MLDLIHITSIAPWLVQRRMPAIYGCLKICPDGNHCHKCSPPLFGNRKQRSDVQRNITHAKVSTCCLPTVGQRPARTRNQQLHLGQGMRMIKPTRTCDRPVVDLHQLKGPSSPWPLTSDGVVAVLRGVSEPQPPPPVTRTASISLGSLRGHG